MRIPFSVAIVAALLMVAPLHAQDLTASCHAASSYDVTLRPDSVLFDRPSPAPARVEMQHDRLRTDDVGVALTPAQQDRLSLFERELRALAPRVRTVAQDGLDMAVQALREEVAGLGVSADTRAQFEGKLATHAGELKQRIARSQSTHDWDGDAIRQYSNSLAADLGQQAIDAAVAGDLQAAARLRDQASSLATELRPRLERRLQALRPQIEALCPAIQRLARLQQGLRDSSGRPLHLLQIDADHGGKPGSPATD